MPGLRLASPEPRSSEGNKQLTLLLSCLSESFNHFMKSGDGAIGASSALGVTGFTFVGGTGERAEEVAVVPLEGEDTTDPTEDDEVIV
jgi:hypothetical protein